MKNKGIAEEAIPFFLIKDFFSYKKSVIIDLNNSSNDWEVSFIEDIG